MSNKVQEKDLIVFEEFSKNGERGFEKTSKDLISEYLHVLRSNILPIILILFVSLLVTFLYVFRAIDIYNATTILQLEPPQGNILQSSFSEMEDMSDERYISNQIEVLKSYKIRDLVAYALLDSIQGRDDFKYFQLLSKGLEEKIPVSHDEVRKR